MRRWTYWILNRYWRILPGLAIFSILWIVFRQWESSSHEDQLLLYAMAIGFAVTVLMQLRYNDAWSIIDVGILFLVGASALTWFRFGESIGRGRPITESESDRIRALFVTALIILLTGYPTYIWRRRQRKRELKPANTGTYGGPDRRKKSPGRRSSDWRHRHHRKEQSRD